jgi:hypothetical protein
MNSGPLATRNTNALRAAATGALLCTALLTGGCGGAHSAAVSVAASSTLTNDVNGLAAAAAAGDADNFSQAAAQMRSDVLDLEASGALTSSRAAAVLAQMQRIVADAALIPTLTASASPATSASVPNTPPPPHGRKNGGSPPGQGKSHG